MAKKIQIGGELENTATGHIVAAASAIKDYTLNKTQNELNAFIEETKQAVEELSPDQTEALALATDVVNLKDDVDQGAVFDVSAKYPTSGVEGGNTYTLELALSVLNANLSADKKNGGMEIKFVDSSDNMYVQYRLMADAWSTTPSDWQGVDMKLIAGSKNLLASGVAAEVIMPIFGMDISPISEEGYIINNGVYEAHAIQTADIVYVTKGTKIYCGCSGFTLRYGCYLQKPVENDVAFSFGTLHNVPDYIDIESDCWLAVSHLSSGTVVYKTVGRDFDAFPTEGSRNFVDSDTVKRAVDNVALKSGEKVKNVSIENAVSAGSSKLPTSGAVAKDIFLVASEGFYLSDVTVEGSGSILTPVNTKNGYYRNNIFYEHETVKTYIYDLSGITASVITSLVSFGDSSNNKVLIFDKEYNLIGGMPYLSTYVGKILRKNNYLVGFTSGTAPVITGYSSYKENYYIDDKNSINGRLKLSGQRINGFDSIVLDVQNLFDFSSEGNLIGKYINPANGQIVDSSSVNTTDFIPVETEQHYSYNSDKIYTGRTVPEMRFIIGYDSNKTCIPNAFNPSSYVNNVTIPNGVAFVRFCYPIDSRIVVFCKGNTPELKINVGSQNIKDDAVTFEKIEFKSPQGINILSPELIIDRPNYYIRSTDGQPYELQNGTAAGYTDYIPIDSRGLYTNAIYIAGSIIGGAYYNSNKEYISGFRTNAIPYVEGAAYVRISLTTTIPDRLVKVGTEAAAYVPYREVIKKDVLPSEVFDKVSIDVPDVINAVVGDTLQLFYICMLRCVNPYIYDISIICDIGQQYPRYFEITPTNSHIGNHSLTITVRRPDSAIIVSKTVTLKVKAVGSAPQSNLKVLCLGASGTNAQIWPREFNRRLTGSGGTPVGLNYSTVELVGGKVATDGTKYEATGGYTFDNYLNTNERLAKFWFYESAVSGKTINEGDIYSFDGCNYTVSEINIPSSDGGFYGYISCKFTEATVGGQGGVLTLVNGTGAETLTFATSATVGNPFAYDGSINIARYANEVCEGGIDVVCTELFGNAMYPYMDELNLSALLDKMKQLIDLFIAYNSSIKFMIGLQWPTDIKGGTGKSYGATGRYSQTNGIKYSVMKLCSMLQEYIKNNELSDYVYIVNWLNEFDLENSYQYVSKPVNVRAVDNATYGITAMMNNQFGNNGIHPSNIGYLQMADSAWRCFVSNIL